MGLSLIPSSDTQPKSIPDQAGETTIPLVIIEHNSGECELVIAGKHANKVIEQSRHTIARMLEIQVSNRQFTEIITTNDIVNRAFFQKMLNENPDTKSFSPDSTIN